jgi:hypothetical protein
MKYGFAFLIIWLSMSLDAQVVKDKVITIDPYMSFQNYEHFTRLTLSSPDSPIEFLDGFDFAWGYTYVLNVRETDDIVPLSDGTQFSYTLNSIVSKTKVPDSTAFKLFIDTNRYYYQLDSSEQDMNATLSQINDSTYLYFDEVVIEVPARLSEKFESVYQGEISKLGTFLYIDDKRIRLIHI